MGRGQQVFTWFLVILVGGMVAAQSQVAEALTLRFSGLLEYQRPAMEELIGEFEQMYPGTQVELAYGAFGVADQDKLITEILGGVGPDLVWFNRVTVPAMAAQRVFEPLDSIIKGRPGLDPSEYIPGILEEGTYRGKIYGMPVLVDVFGVVWNKDMFAAAGFDRDEPPRTWDDMRSMARRMTTVDGTGALQQIGFMPRRLTSRPWLYTQGAQAGVRFVDEQDRVHLDDPRIVDCMQWNLETVNLLGGWQHVSQASWPLSAGRSAMDPSREPAVLQELDNAGVAFEVGVAASPAPRGTAPVAFVGGWALAIPIGLPKERLTAAVDLMAWLLKPENQTRRFFTSRLGLPAHRRALQQVASGIHQLPHAREMRAYLELTSIAVPRGTSPINIDVLQGLEQAVTDVVNLKKTPQESLLAVNRVLQAKLDEFNLRLKN